MKNSRNVICCMLLSLLPIGVVRAADASSDCTFPSSWIEGEYLYWWVKNSPESVTLITEGSSVLDQSTVLGDKNIHTGPRSGVRVGVGYLFGSEQMFGIEGRYLFLGQTSYSKTVSSSGLSRSDWMLLPFFNPVTSEETFTPIARPIEVASIPPFSGEATLKLSNYMQDAELNASFILFKTCPSFHLQALAGFLWWNFNEHFTLSTSSPYVSDPESIFETKDQFKTHNNFYGGQIGFESEYTWKKLYFLLRGQVALGAMNSHLNIQGQLKTNGEIITDGPLESFGSGYFALSTNNGRHNDTHFSVIPQVKTQIGFNFTKWLSINVGYTFLYATKVMWANNQIDNNINPTQAPAITGNDSTTVVGPRYPQALLKTSSFWAQGLSAGLEFQF